ncbi:DUF3043 domain-containing protein [Pseudonocardia ailaonensis]|uniref:DUF3043 domain-containing protein n=1 Tax=Pseudonocardia ailaonensis TaxID=367279 RepID=A0ABN2NPD4_9PSEU
MSEQDERKPLDPRWTQGKGKPTPKRRDAQTVRRGPAPPPPKTQREASRLAKENRPSKDVRRAQAADRRARMDAGDDRVLLPRDRGPVKAYVRDVVDSKRHLMGLFMPLAVIVLISVLLPIPSIQQYLSLFSLVVLAVMVGEGVLLGMRTTRAARAKFPEERISGLGLGWYTFTRASQIRKLRVPKPKVQIGAPV